MQEARDIKTNTVTYSYNSITEFYRYLCDTPFNEAFRWERHSSVECDYRFAQTNSFEEATDLLKHGWTDMSQTLTRKMQVADIKMAPVRKPRNVLGVAGYQPVVPLYLAGVPINMIDKQLINVKQKVIDIVKLINYSGGVSKEKIVEESIKAMQVIKKLEAQGYRANLYVALSTTAGSKTLLCKIKVKSASEKLNVSKLAFPLVHPSMLRRLLFRFIEVCPEATRAYVGGYGRPTEYDNVCKQLPKCVVLPSIWESKVEDIATLDQLKASV